MIEISPHSRWLALMSEAAAPILSLLVRRCGEKLPSTWAVTDEPSHPEGLVGGRVDDAGFETRTSHPGMTSPEFFQRRSFRDSPTTGLSNLIVKATDRQDRPEVFAIVSGSRVVPLGPEDWVVELDLIDGDKWRARLSPSVLAGSLGPTFGSSRSTPDGPIVPGILLDTQSLDG